jgi:hypothetical protein
MGLPQEVCEAGQEVAAATGADLSDILNGALGRFLGWPLRVTSGCVVDREGIKTETFASVIYAAPEGSAVQNPDAIPSDAVGAIIDACETMDLEKFRAAYRRIAQAKRLKKTAAPHLNGIPITTVTLGIIFAQRLALPLEHFVEELERLNTQTPSREWPDMVVVALTGVINYAVQFPGESVSGDFLPPAEGAPANYTPPMYVIIVMRPTGAYTFNKMIAFLIGHLAIFSPGAKLPNWSHILEGVPRVAVTSSGYQYNLSGDLLPVPRQFYNDRYLPPLPMRIEDRQGNLLSTIQFLPWQEGGTILLKGKLPLEGLLVFLGLDKEARMRAGVVKRPSDTQISYVLPIQRAHFHEMLARIQRRSNMVVRSDQTKLVIQKLGEEGTRSPFIARVFMGLLRLRDMVYPDPAKRDQFDKSYDLVISSLLNARTTAREIVELWDEHVRKVTSGEIARLEGKALHIDENIDKELGKQVESFLNTAARVLKQGMQSLARELQINIGFLFKKPSTYEVGIAVLQKTDPHLADYLRQVRVWSERLMESRNAIEHKGWMLPRIMYSPVGSGIRADEPLISDQPVSEFVKFIFDRLACFVEEFTVHCLQRRLPEGITFTEIGLADRLAEVPERFRVTLSSGGLPAWRITYHLSSFETT